MKGVDESKKNREKMKRIQRVYKERPDNDSERENEDERRRKERERSRKGKASWRSSSAAVVGGASVPDTAGVNSRRPYDLLELGN